MLSSDESSLGEYLKQDDYGQEANRLGVGADEGLFAICLLAA